MTLPKPGYWKERCFLSFNQSVFSLVDVLIRKEEEKNRSRKISFSSINKERESIFK